MPTIQEYRDALAKACATLEAAEHWLAEEAASPHPGQTRPDDILRVIREALGKPHDAPDAAPRPTIQDYRAALDALIPLAHDRAADMSEIADEDGKDGNHDDAKAAWEAVEAARALMAGHATDAPPAAPPNDFDAIATPLRALLADMAEEISLDDLQHHPGLRRLVLACDDLSNRVGRAAMDWAKTTAEGAADA